MPPPPAGLKRWVDDWIPVLLWTPPDDVPIRDDVVSFSLLAEDHELYKSAIELGGRVARGRVARTTGAACCWLAQCTLVSMGFAWSCLAAQVPRSAWCRRLLACVSSLWVKLVCMPMHSFPGMCRCP